MRKVSPSFIALSSQRIKCILANLGWNVIISAYYLYAIIWKEKLRRMADLQFDATEFKHQNRKSAEQGQFPLQSWWVLSVWSWTCCCSFVPDYEVVNLNVVVAVAADVVVVVVAVVVLVDAVKVVVATSRNRGKLKCQHLDRNVFLFEPELSFK